MDKAVRSNEFEFEDMRPAESELISFISKDYTEATVGDTSRFVGHDNYTELKKKMEKLFSTINDNYSDNNLDYINKLNFYLAFSLPDMKNFIENAKIKLTEDEIKEYLSKKMDEEEPGLKERLEKMKNTSSIITFTSNEEENNKKIKASNQKMHDLSIASKYYFEPYSLKYFKTYVSILREKCMTLYEICHILYDIRDKVATDEQRQKLEDLDLDLHINENGDLYYEDIDRIVDAITYNFDDLNEKLKMGNDPETYLTFKESEHRLLKDGIFESEIYPRKDVQIKDLRYAHLPQFIAPSKKQEEELKQEQIKNISYWIDRCFDDDDDELNPKLKMQLTNN